MIYSFRYIFYVLIYLCFIYACTLSHFGRVWGFVIPWTVTCQAPLTMGFSQQEYGSGLIAISSSRRSSWPRRGTHICIAGGFFTAEPHQEALFYIYAHLSLSLSLSLTHTHTHTHTHQASIPQRKTKAKQRLVWRISYFCHYTEMALVLDSCLSHG